MFEEGVHVVWHCGKQPEAQQPSGSFSVCCVVERRTLTLTNAPSNAEEEKVVGADCKE